MGSGNQVTVPRVNHEIGNRNGGHAVHETNPVHTAIERDESAASSVPTNNRFGFFTSSRMTRTEPSSANSEAILFQL